MHIQTLGTTGVELLYPNCFNPTTSRFSRAASLLRYYPKTVVIHVVLNGGYVDFRYLERQIKKRD